MIVSFKHKGLARFYQTGNHAGVQAAHVPKLRRILSNLNHATIADDLDLPGYALHRLKGSRRDIWSIRVNGNWRVTFRFIGQDVELVNYEDYH